VAEVGQAGDVAGLEVTSAVRTPRSMPVLPPWPVAATAGCGAGNETCQRPARSQVTRAMPSPVGSGRVQRNLTQPHFGTCTSPQRPFSLRTLVSRIAKPRTCRLLR